MNMTTVCLFAALANFHAADLTKLDASKVRVYKPDAIVWVQDGKATMPIVARPGKRRYGPRGWEYPALPEAERLARIVFEMTGVKPPIVIEKEGAVATNSPAVYIGSSACERFGKYTGEPPKDAPCPESEAFRVVSEKGSLYFTGFTSHAVADFAERALGLRCYWNGKDGGWSYVKTATLKLPEIDYTDAPVYPRRTMWPFAHYDWYPMWKVGNSWPVHLDCHQPYKWWGETNFNYKATRPEIFQLGRDGKRQPPMLCYGNPKTFETYKERLELELAGGPKAGMYNAPSKTITVSQWDGLIDCQCEHCKPLYDQSRGTTGNASPIIWGFAAKLADWLHEKHPDITVTILPYLNSCDVPKGLAFPHKNVEAEVCSMPGLALFKNKDVQDHEEGLIRAWEKVTGRPIRSWNYFCWPAEFCAAPYAFGHAAVEHYKRMRGHIVGAFMNGTGTEPEKKLILGAYVWMRAMWNPELDVEAVYDAFAERMFGAAAKPMRRLVAMQEEGWARQWAAGQCSNKNVYEISYPRKDVVEMENLIAEAKALAKDDPLVIKRIERYTRGWQPFFDESKNLAEGTALEPTHIKKIASDPIVDGKLDDEAWSIATGYPFVHSMCKTNSTPKYKSELKMVWTPNGVTFGLKCFDPLCGNAAAMEKIRKVNSFEEIEIFLDVSGTGDGHWYQIFMEDSGDPLYYTDGPVWQPKGIRKGVHYGQGFWSLELFVPFADLKGFVNAQMPSGTSAEGKFWIGNVIRHRRWDGVWYGKRKAERTSPDSTEEYSRRYTRYSIWSKDASAFGKLQFVE